MRALFVLLCFLVASCGNSLVRSGSSPPPTRAPETVGESVGVTPGPPATPASQAAKSSGPPLVVTIVDQNKRNPPNIPVRVSGPVTQNLLSDSSGKVTVNAPPGNYRLEVPAGCHDKVMISFGGTASAAIAPNQSATGTLKVQWQQRYVPGLPVFSSSGSDWPLGQKITLRYSVQDRCEEADQAPGASIETYRFTPSANLRIVSGPGLRSNSDGVASIDVECTAAGRPSLVAADSLNPPDSVDLAQQDSASNRPPECRSAPAGY